LQQAHHWGCAGQCEALAGAGDAASSTPLSIPVPTVNAFWVTVQRTEAAERCELRGTYVLKAERDSLVLKDPRTNEILYIWPYRLLRRYGRDKVG
ncbi:DOK1 protein, partial [Centropus bengalensis]|nr:DOK1 protein [Centropus bengalensis]